MGTTMVLFDCDANALEAHFRKHLALYRSRGDDAENFDVLICAGVHCAAIYSPHLACPEGFLRPMGPQLAGLWMDVDYQKGMTWQLSCYTGFLHELSHDVNPWSHDLEYVYHQKSIDYRINKLERLLPQFKDAMRPYLLLWREPSNPNAPEALVARTGKAREGDHSEYGNPLQYIDFLDVFGIQREKPVKSIKVRL